MILFFFIAFRECTEILESTRVGTGGGELGRGSYVM